MATLDDVRRIASTLPGVSESPVWFALTVPIKGKDKGFVWTWSERVHPKKAKVMNPGVLVVRVRSLTEKEILINSAGGKFFTEPHYNGYPAVHVWLAAIEPDELEDLIIEAYRVLAPADLLRQFEAMRESAG